MVRLIDHQINSDLPENEQHKLVDVLQEFPDVFAASSDELGKTNGVEHEIDIQRPKPMKCKGYRASHKEREIIDTQIQEMLENGITEPSSSPWGFPLVLTKKKEGSTR
ncbi:hypothetical protein Zmor_001966 [Zophobas morio]|uniref:Uncharacterized protein n=1 Tax=Zophobas morio TaxID=2755281 RepID=A0AA38IZS4_9CUCU|nr:hypothetical protein Zmor_001966 [Zophobas morio]